MTILEGVKNFIRICPYISILEDHLDEKGYRVEQQPEEAVVKLYADGSSKRQFIFTISSRSYYEPGEMEGLQDSEFYEALSEWLEERSQKKEFPDMDDGKAPESIRALTCELKPGDSKTQVKYQVTCKLEYLSRVLPD